MRSPARSGAESAAERQDTAGARRGLRRGIARPFIGPALAFVLYMVIRGGFFGSNSNVNDANTFAFIGLAALAGAFSEEAIRKLKTIAASLFEQPEKGKDSASGPSITGIAPSPLTAATTTITVTGRNFDATSKVFADNTALATTFKNATTLDAQIPAGLHNGGGTLTITVRSGSGTTSTGTKLPMT